VERHTIVHFEIPANDIERLKRFYSECFGWEFRNSGMPGMEYWLISTGPQGESIGGGMYVRMAPEERPRNFINVADIDEAIARFKAAGGIELVGKAEVPGQGFSFIGADPEGNPIALWEPRMPAIAPRRKAAKRVVKRSARRTTKRPARRKR
jgi:hypothetical protein